MVLATTRASTRWLALSQTETDLRARLNSNAVYITSDIGGVLLQAHLDTSEVISVTTERLRRVDEKVVLMATNGHALPADLFHLIANELSDRNDFATLYNYLVSSKHLAASGAIAALYRISHRAPVKGGGGDLYSGLADQEQVVQRWSILWRTITLSAFDKTIYPYCKHLEFLDLRDLASLLEDDKFRGKISKNFFSGPLAQFHFLDQTQSASRRAAPRLDIKKIITAIGKVITQHAPRLEALSEPVRWDMLSEALPEWAPRLTHLRALDLWDGKALADETTRNLLHSHCPNLSSLSIYISSNDDADHCLATFISGMPANALIYFENYSNCRIGAETCSALNSHGKSLKSLKLKDLSHAGVLALALLQGCTSLLTLTLEALSPSVDLKATQNDVFLQIVEWLRTSTSMRDISFNNFISAPDLLLPVLLNKKIPLEKLQINASNDGGTYIVKDHLDFHEALSQQPSLQSLVLRGDSDQITRDGIEVLLNSFCSLTDLRELHLTRVSDYFSDEHINLLTKHLNKLENLYIGGYGISDAVWPSLTLLQNLKVVTFSGITTFTTSGIIDFVDQLGDGNAGLQLSVDSADPDGALPQEEQDLITEAIVAKVDGRFEYQLLRDPNMPDFDSEDSD